MLNNYLYEAYGRWLSWWTPNDSIQLESIRLNSSWSSMNYWLLQSLSRVEHRMVNFEWTVVSTQRSRLSLRLIRNHYYSLKQFRCLVAYRSLLPFVWNHSSSSFALCLCCCRILTPLPASDLVFFLLFPVVVGFLHP